MEVIRFSAMESFINFYEFLVILFEVKDQGSMS